MLSSEGSGEPKNKTFDLAPKSVHFDAKSKGIPLSYISLRASGFILGFIYSI